MAVPDFQSMMLPLLQCCADGQVHTLNEVRTRLAAHFALSEDDLEQMLPSGRQRTFDNRVSWAKSHLQGAGLVAKGGRGQVQITERAQQLLATHPQSIGMAELNAYPEYTEWRGTRSSRASASDRAPASPSADEQTPRERLDHAYRELRDALAAELIEQLMSQSPAFFEQVVVDLLVAMGYGGTLEDAGTAFQRGSDDGGVDGVIKQDRLGLDAVYVQAKRWAPGQSVQRQVVQGFVGSLVGLKASKGVLLTTASFTTGALNYAESLSTAKVVLIDGKQLAQLMIDFNVGVSDVQTYTVKQVDSDYFLDDEA